MIESVVAVFIGCVVVLVLSLSTYRWIKIMDGNEK